MQITNTHALLGLQVERNALLETELAAAMEANRRLESRVKELEESKDKDES